MLFSPLCRESEAILFKPEIFVPVTWAGALIRENFHSVLPEILVPASDKNTSRLLGMEKWRGEISETEPARSTGFI